MNYITLKELCKECDVTRRAIQGYEQAELIAPCDKNDRGHLLYDCKSIERVKIIKRYQNYGFSIKEIQKVIDAPSSVLKEELKKKAVFLLQQQLELCETIQEIYDLIDSL